MAFSGATWLFTTKSTVIVLQRERATQNTGSVAQHFLNFITYYSHVFDYENDVVSIRVRVDESLTKLEKQWTSKCMAVEDPFDLDHNLATGLSKQMFKVCSNCAEI